MTKIYCNDSKSRIILQKDNIAYWFSSDLFIAKSLSDKIQSYIIRQVKPRYSIYCSLESVIRIAIKIRECKKSWFSWVTVIKTVIKTLAFYFYDLLKSVTVKFFKICLVCIYLTFLHFYKNKIKILL